ncbi:MAG: ABC transporter permease [Candidatus Thermoplasmatota archaeon]|nr:ABC transporter permease [Candidatus Thermoplasmatota archaeon]MBU1940356.1 ABC transporter permease [Candidatus Thermoplasmatota archaeon]
MFIRILRKSLLKRKSRIAIAIISVIMGAAIATALLSVSSDVSEKVGLEFRKYGANLILIPETDTIEIGFPGVDFGSVTEQRYINESDLWKIKTIFWRNNVLGFAPFLYQIIKINDGTTDHELVLAGTYFNKEIHILEPYLPTDKNTFTTGVQDISSWWQVTGNWITNQNDTTHCMIGAKVAEKLNLQLGQTITIKYIDTKGNNQNTTSYNLTILGIVETQGNEDNQIFVNLQVAQTLTNRPDNVHTVQVSALCNACPVETFAEEIVGKIPYTEARTVKQLVSAEMSILSKIENMMFLITIVALLASALGVTTTMTTSVIERQKEIGLMKSIGAENKKIIALFLSEAAIIGIIGGILGYLLGILLAQFIGISVFTTSINPRIEIIPIAIGISMGVSILASILPVRRAVKVEPAIVLRGE